MPDGPRRPRGRPRVDEPSVRCSTRLRVKDFDRLAKIALLRDESMSSLLRSLVCAATRRDAPPTEE